MCMYAHAHARTHTRLQAQGHTHRCTHMHFYMRACTRAHKSHEQDVARLSKISHQSISLTARLVTSDERNARFMLHCNQEFG